MAVIETLRASIAGRNPAESETGQKVGKTVTSVGGILAAIGAASCCVIPLALVMAGISGAWIGTLTGLAPYQPYFIALTAIFLAGGFYLVYRKPKAACAEGSYCAKPSSNRIAKISLWSATVLVALAIAFPYVAPLIFDI